jgi:hypothetical protein
MEVIFMVLPLYPWRKIPRYPFYRRLGGPHSRTRFCEEKKSCPCQESNSGSSARILVAIGRSAIPSTYIRAMEVEFHNGNEHSPSLSSRFNPCKALRSIFWRLKDYIAWTKFCSKWVQRAFPIGRGRFISAKTRFWRSNKWPRSEGVMHVWHGARFFFTWFR